MTARPDYFDKYKTLAFERSDDGVLVVRFHSDNGKMIYGSEHHSEWTPAFTDIGADRANRVIVMTGTGDAFSDSHGAHGAVPSPLDWDIPSWGQRTMLDRLLAIEAPIVSAINGPATIHAELLVLGNIVLAADTTELADEGHFVVGETPGDGVHLVWQELLGVTRGQYFLLTGQRISAQEALQLGVVSEVMSMDALMPRALELAHQLATYSDLTLRYTRRLLVDRWKQLIADRVGVGYGMAMEALSYFDRGWVVWDKSNEGKDSYHRLQRLQPAVAQMSAH